MSKRNLADKVKLTSVDDLFGLTDEETKGQIIPNLDGQIVEVPLVELHTFRNHPFRVLDDEKMDETVESIKEYGVLAPGILQSFSIISSEAPCQSCVTIMSK